MMTKELKYLRSWENWRKYSITKYYNIFLCCSSKCWTLCRRWWKNISHYWSINWTDTDKVIAAGTIPVIFYNEDTNIPITIECSTSGGVSDFELTCVAPQNFNAKINNAKAQVDETPITFSASTEDANNLKITGAGNTSNNNVYYRKNYSGLSGGVIAGIVIACAVVLILITILAMYLRRPKPTMDNNSTIVGLRSVDNYQE